MRFFPALALLLALGLADAATAQTSVTRLLKEGDNVAGVGNVTSVDNLAVNEGGTVRVEVDTDNADTTSDSAIIDASLGVVRREGESLAAPSGATLSLFVPNKASGRTVYMQAAQRLSCIATNRVVYAFP